jgi:hypothetical protein
MANFYRLIAFFIAFCFSHSAFSLGPVKVVYPFGSSYFLQGVRDSSPDLVCARFTANVGLAANPALNAAVPRVIFCNLALGASWTAGGTINSPGTARMEVQLPYPPNCPAHSLLINSSYYGDQCICEAGYTANAAQTACIVESACQAGTPISSNVGLGWYPKLPSGTADSLQIFRDTPKAICAKVGISLCDAAVGFTNANLRTGANNNFAVTVGVAGSLTGTECAGPALPADVLTPEPPCAGQSGTVNGVSVCLPTESPAQKEQRAQDAAAQAARDAVAASAGRGETPEQQTAAGKAAADAAGANVRAGGSNQSAAAAGAAAGAAGAAGSTAVDAAAKGAGAAAAADAVKKLEGSGLTPAQIQQAADAARSAADAEYRRAIGTGATPSNATGSAGAAGTAAGTARASGSTAGASGTAGQAAGIGASAGSPGAGNNPTGTGSTGSGTATGTTTGTGTAGSGTTGTGTGTDGPNPVDDFCKKNPQAAMCKTELDSTFGGACGAAPACTGDAVQCATAAAVFSTNCELIKQGAEKQSYETERAKPQTNVAASQAGAETKEFGPSNFSASEQFAVQCLPDLTLTVAGHTGTFPLSNVCMYLEQFGAVLLSISFLLAARIITRG